MLSHYDYNYDSDYDLPSSPTSSTSEDSFDEDEVNQRISPHWPLYRCIFMDRGLRLDTVRDVKAFWEQRLGCLSEEMVSAHHPHGFLRVCQNMDDDALCPDAGLPDTLFRGTRTKDGKKFVAKAVNLQSREFEVVRLLSTPPLRDDPANHTIPILDLIEVECDGVAFIVMEEWLSDLIPETGRCCFLSALRQCIEHVEFLHRNHIAHLDISMRNLLRDNNGRYAYIDYELSRRFEGQLNPSICAYRGTEIPPECEGNTSVDPFKVDIWALAVLILRTCKMAGQDIPELMKIVGPMLSENPCHRPSASMTLRAFNQFTQFRRERAPHSICDPPH